MTLKEMAKEYARSAEAVRAEVYKMRLRVQEETDREKRRLLMRKFFMLAQIWRELRDTGKELEDYYEP